MPPSFAQTPARSRVRCGVVISALCLNALGCPKSSNASAADSSPAPCVACKVVFDPVHVVEARPPGTTQREPSIEIDGKGTVWIAFIDFPAIGVNDPHVRYTRSTDGGRTFEPSKEACAGCGDPVLAVDSSDRVFLSTIEWKPRVVKLTRIDTASDNPGGSVVVSNPTDPYPDREWMVVDKNDEICLTWNAGLNADNAIFFARSTDHGKSFGLRARVAGPIVGEHIVYGALAIGHDGGSINVALPSGVLGASASTITTKHVWLVRSTDGGKVFSPPIALSATAEQPIPGPLGSFKALWVNWPSVVAARNGEVVVTLPTQRTGAPDAIDIVTSRSTDGKTFSTPIVANDGEPTVRTMPWSTFGDDGALHVFWLDARKYPGGKNAPWSVYYARSIDGGRSFETNLELSTDRVFGDPGARVDFAIGEFNAIRSRGQTIYAVWSGAVTNDVDLFVAVGHITR